MFRLADGVVVREVSRVLTISRPDEAPLELPDDAGSLRTLMDLLTEPATEAELRTRLATKAKDRGASRPTVDRLADGLELLLAHRVVVGSDLPTRLSDVHGQTVAPGSWPLGDAGEETARILREQAAGSVVLPPAAPVDVGLQQALSARRSPKTFSDASLSLQALATILALGVGSRTVPAFPLAPGGPPGPRTYPSAGGLYPVEVLVYPTHVDQVRPEFYLYQVQSHRLARAGPPMSIGALRSLLNDHPVERAAVLVLLFSDLTRPSLGKYGEKAYRMLLLEAGHVAQNVLLVGATQGLQGLPICGFRDADLTRAAGLRWPYQPVLYVLALGREGHGSP